MTIEYENAQELKANHSTTFQAPEIDFLRANIRPGDFVKVCASGVPGEAYGERFWLEVTALVGDTITGTVANELINHPLNYGEKVSVTLDRVYSYMRSQKGQ